MYQFSEMFKELNPEAPRPTQRWRGLAVGLLLGWVPAWAVAHWAGGGGWSFSGIWLLSVLLGYLTGNRIYK